MADGRGWRCGGVVNRGKSGGGLFGGITTKLVCGRIVQLHLIGITLRLDKYILIDNITSSSTMSLMGNGRLALSAFGHIGVFLSILDTNIMAEITLVRQIGVRKGAVMIKNF